MNQVVSKNIHTYMKQDDIVVVGVSGGPDSLALLHYLWKYEKQFKIICAHVDHQLRGETSFEDYKFVERFCQQRGIIFEGSRIDVKTYKEEQGVSTQVAARHCRYQFFEMVMAKHNATYLALGHHGDDQIETIVMNQVRGTVGVGLAGIPVTREFGMGKIIRPFLGITKAEIEQYCKEENLLPRTDESNTSLLYTRNRFRKVILPFFKDENPNVHTHFQKQSEWIQEDEMFLEKLTTEALKEAIIEKKPEYIKIDVMKVREMAIPLQRRGIHLILKYLYGKIHPSIKMIHIEQIIDVLHATHPSGQVSLPNGMKAIRSYNHCSFTYVTNHEKRTIGRTWTIPGSITLDSGVLTGQRIPSSEVSGENGKNVLIVDANAISLPLYVRTRQEGDKIAPMGMTGSKKISRIFIDNKVDTEKRDNWPIVTDADGDIIWVPCFVKSRKGMIDEASTSCLVLTFKAYH
ncbi:tRNA lysidine(34) synthetase TilS [Alkalihalobacterium bogoriense]|uniref:tRNA lysidine(34) synthetase TilS n=1 Tax=Alkalihalobacterium bogoriense TaxID=246272 RepID=UPI0005504D47|nr:tRNA lysidine(34) synthetase TilS [Alkalihalobacterium bogoriense]